MKIVMVALSLLILIGIGWELCHSIFFMSTARGNNLAISCMIDEKYIDDARQVTGVSLPYGKWSGIGMSSYRRIDIKFINRQGTAEKASVDLLIDGDCDVHERDSSTVIAP